MAKVELVRNNITFYLTIRLITLYIVLKLYFDKYVDNLYSLVGTLDRILEENCS